MKNRIPSKNIVIISLNYYPEDTAIGFYSTKMTEYLHFKGWNVTVITGFPYYPKWEIAKEYKVKKKYFEEEINGVKIIRYKQFVPSNPSFFTRILHIIDFTFGSFFNINKIQQASVVLSIIPFTSSAWLGKKLSKKIKAKHWIHVQDFEFNIALDSGISSNKRLKKYFSKRLFNFESKILNSANIVSTISFGMLEKLKNKSTSETYYFPNWIDSDLINPSKANLHKILKSKKFKILYSGNIAAKQDWDLFLKIVNAFKDNDHIEFIVVGNGSAKKKLIEQTKNFKNVNHFNSVPFNELNDLLCSADLHILFQKGNVIDTVMPSKILGMMASEVPSLVTGNIESEVAKMFKSSKIGYFYKCTDLPLIIKKIKNLISDKTKGKAVGENARKYIVNSFSSKKILKNFNKKLIEINEN